MYGTTAMQQKRSKLTTDHLLCTGIDRLHHIQTLSGRIRLFYALTNWNGLNKTYDIVGFSNFVEILSDRYFWNSILFTMKYVIVFVIVANVVALTLAVAIESRPKARGFFRTIFYMPNMISMVIGGYMWMFIFTKVPLLSGR